MENAVLGALTVTQSWLVILGVAFLGTVLVLAEHLVVQHYQDGRISPLARLVLACGTLSLCLSVSFAWLSLPVSIVLAPWITSAILGAATVSAYAADEQRRLSRENKANRAELDVRREHPEG